MMNVKFIKILSEQSYAITSRWVGEKKLSGEKKQLSEKRKGITDV